MSQISVAIPIANEITSRFYQLSGTKLTVTAKFFLAKLFITGVYGTQSNTIFKAPISAPSTVCTRVCYVF